MKNDRYWKKMCVCGGRRGLYKIVFVHGLQKFSDGSRNMIDRSFNVFGDWSITIVTATQISEYHFT
jgi:hypothetical protein